MVFHLVKSEHKLNFPTLIGFCNYLVKPASKAILKALPNLVAFEGISPECVI